MPRPLYRSARTSSRDYFSPRSVRAKVARHIKNRLLGQKRIFTKVATWRIWGRAVLTPTCMSLMPCSGRACQPPYQDRPVWFSSMDVCVGCGPSGRDRTYDQKFCAVTCCQCVRYTYLSECYTSPIVNRSFLPSPYFVLSLPHPATRLRKRVMQKKKHEGLRRHWGKMMTTTSDDSSSCIITCLKSTNSFFFRRRGGK